ncbi:MAG: nucleotidyltransferase [Clostridia bacterium]|nr:nucleotidyltransferase [Clostridia bacterium]
MCKTTLVIMAAGIGSRFGEGIKQLTKIGKNGEIILDYSIYDAIRAGFDKVVFVIRKDIEEEFMEVIGNRIKEVVETEIAFQEIDDLPKGFAIPEGRKKPWGTGQAILACKQAVSEPFAVINADDFYGREPFELLHSYLVEEHDTDGLEDISMAGYILKNVLSDNGFVTRGLCSVDEEGYLVGIKETSNIGKDGDKVYIAEEDGSKTELDPGCNASMNMWGFRPSYFDRLAELFPEFLENMENPLKSEFLLPIIVGDMLEKGETKVKVLETNEKWYGMTYKEDKEIVATSIRKLVDAGLYPENIMEELKK